MFSRRARVFPPLIAAVLLILLSSCSPQTASESDGSSSTDDSATSNPASPTDQASDLATCEDLDVLHLADTESEYPGAARTAVTLADLAPLPAVSFPVADCAWRTTPAPDPSVSGEFWVVEAFYLTDDSALFDDISAQLESIGCYHASTEQPSEWFCNVEGSETAEGWVVTFADYTFSFGDGNGQASELDVSYQNG